jgi:hypothetical protein
MVTVTAITVTLRQLPVKMITEIGAKSPWGRSQRLKVFRQPAVSTDHQPQATDHCRVQKAIFALGSLQKWSLLGIF